MKWTMQWNSVADSNDADSNDADYIRAHGTLGVYTQCATRSRRLFTHTCCVVLFL